MVLSVLGEFITELLLDEVYAREISNMHLKNCMSSEEKIKSLKFCNILKHAVWINISVSYYVTTLFYINNVNIFQTAGLNIKQAPRKLFCKQSHSALPAKC